MIGDGSLHGDQKGTRCGEFSQCRGCPRNCKRRIFRHMPLGISVLGRRRRVRTREPGDLPSAKPITTSYNDAEVSLDTNMTRRLAVDSGGAINPNVSYRINAT